MLNVGTINDSRDSHKKSNYAILPHSPDYTPNTIWFLFVHGDRGICLIIVSAAVQCRCENQDAENNSDLLGEICIA